MHWHRIETQLWSSGAAAKIGSSAFAVYLAIRAAERFRRGRGPLECRLLERWRGSVISFAELARTTGLSRATVRRAMARLEEEGWIQCPVHARGGRERGWFVAIGERDCEPFTLARLAEVDRPTDELRGHGDPSVPLLRGHGDPSDRSRRVMVTPQFLDKSSRSQAEVSFSLDRSELDRSELDRRSVPLGDPEQEPTPTQETIMHETDDPRFPRNWQPPLDEDEGDEVVARPKRIERLSEIEKPPPVERKKRRAEALLESARRKWNENRAGEYTGEEAVAAWCYRYERELGFPDPELRTERTRKQIASLFVRRTNEWAAGDRATMLRYVRETFSWWVEANRQKKNFPGGLPSYAALLRVKPDGTISWFWKNWRAGGTVEKANRR